jgi:hypothetical protein
MAHAIPDPRAMVVHSAHTLAANGTVMTPRWPDVFALEAVSPVDQSAVVRGEQVLNTFFYVRPLVIRHPVDSSLERVRLIPLSVLDECSVF